MSLASRLPTFLPTTSWLLFLVCISPSFCAALWESHSGSSDVVRLEHGPKFNIPDAIRRQAWSGRTAENGGSVRIQEYPAKLDLNQGFVPQSDDESSSEWETVLDPRFYIITELGNSGDAEESASRGIRKRRNANPSPSLSIVNPLDVLRQRLLFEIARRRQIQSHSQIRANNEILRNIGRK